MVTKTHRIPLALGAGLAILAGALGTGAAVQAEPGAHRPRPALEAGPARQAAPPQGPAIHIDGYKTPAGHLPRFQQLGNPLAKVPMKHGLKGVYNGNKVSTHVLATSHGNLKMPGKVSMSCPAGKAVSWLSYRVQGQNEVVVIGGPTKAKSYAKKVKIAPFSAGELGEACRVALGGDWLGLESHKNTAPVATRLLKKQVQVRGACTGWANKVMRSHPVTLKVRCVDQSWNPPVP